MRIFRFFIAAYLALVLMCPVPTAAQDATFRKSDIIRLLGQLPEFTPIREDMAALGSRAKNWILP